MLSAETGHFVKALQEQMPPVENKATGNDIADEGTGIHLDTPKESLP